MASFFKGEGDNKMDHPENPNKSSFFNRSLTIHHPRSASYGFAAMERLGSVKKLHNSSSFASSAAAGNSFKGKVKKLCSFFEKSPPITSPDSQSPIPSPKPAKSVSIPGTEDRVVIYFTSLRGIRKTYTDCYAVRMIFKGYRVNIDERDISMDCAYKKELQSLLGEKTTLCLPQVFIKGKLIGGADVVRQLNETGELGKLLKGLPIRTLKPGLGYMCEGCGDIRFLPCPNCNGSRKVFDEDEEQPKRCPDCNENGLVRCSECCS